MSRSQSIFLDYNFVLRCLFLKCIFAAIFLFYNFFLSCFLLALFQCLISECVSPVRGAATSAANAGGSHFVHSISPRPTVPNKVRFIASLHQLIILMFSRRLI